MVKYRKGKRRETQGQSTVEYVLLVTAVIVVILVFNNPTTGNRFAGKLNSTLEDVSGEITNKTTRLDTSLKGTAPKDTGKPTATVPAGSSIDITKARTWKMPD